MLPELNNKDVNIAAVAEKALGDAQLLSELLAGLKSKKETFRYNCSRVLTLISEEHGEVLYPYWDYFVEFLSSKNTYQEISALLIIANLTRVDAGHRFEEIFDKYYGLLDGRSMITAIYAARNSGKIVKAKPELEARITSRLLSIDKTRHEPERRELIKSGAIEALSEYFGDAENQEKILAFVTGQLNSASPKTRKVAGEFLKKMGEFKANRLIHTGTRQYVSN